MGDRDFANDLPDWWPYPVQCGHGHPWSPGHVIVSYLPCASVLTTASPGTPWSGARPMAAAQPSTARATTRPTRRPPTPLGSQAGSHRHPTQGDPEPTEAFDITAITSHPATAADTSRLAGSRSHQAATGSWRRPTAPPHVLTLTSAGRDGGAGRSGDLRPHHPLSAAELMPATAHGATLFS
jgi:hypothetical protein